MRIPSVLKSKEYCPAVWSNKYKDNLPCDKVKVDDQTEGYLWQAYLPDLKRRNSPVQIGVKFNFKRGQDAPDNILGSFLLSR